MEKAIEQETGSSAKVEMEADGAIEVKTDEGTYTAGKNELPADWPADVPAYAGATVAYAASVEGAAAGNAGSALMLTTEDGVQTVSDHYRRVLAENGWTFSTTMQSGGTAILGATKGDRTLSMLIAEAEGRTSITIGLEGK